MHACGSSPTSGKHLKEMRVKKENCLFAWWFVLYFLFSFHFPGILLLAYMSDLHLLGEVLRAVL